MDGEDDPALAETPGYTRIYIESGEIRSAGSLFDAWWIVSESGIKLSQPFPSHYFAEKEAIRYAGGFSDVVYTKGKRPKR